MNALATAGNPKGVNGVALAVLIALSLLVTVMGFMASRWRRGTSMESLDEWGLGGSQLKDLGHLVPAGR